MRKINALLCEWSVERFENQPAKVLCIYFIIYCYCGGVAIKSAGINSPCVFDRSACVWTEGSSVPSGAFRENTARRIPSRDIFLFTLHLKQKYQPIFQCYTGAHHVGRQKKVSFFCLFLLIYTILRTEITESSSLSTMAIHLLSNHRSNMHFIKIAIYLVSLTKTYFSVRSRKGCMMLRTSQISLISSVTELPTNERFQV